MFTHIVMWKLKETAAGRSRAENAALIKQQFEELANMLDGLHHLEVGIDVLRTNVYFDIVLFTQFDARADYEAYDRHPAHKALAASIADLRDERRVIDYET